LRWRDLDFDRCLLNVWQGKGRSDRQVMLPETFRGLLAKMSQHTEPDDYIFPAGKDGGPSGNGGRRVRRHLSSRTVQRVMARAMRIAGIGKRATPHSLRHSFACHTYEYTCDLRKIQKILGHVRLETTTIYVRAARPMDGQAVISPLDEIMKQRAAKGRPGEVTKPPVGRVRIHLKREADDERGGRRAKVTLGIA
jgi:integrase